MAASACGSGRKNGSAGGRTKEWTKGGPDDVRSDNLIPNRQSSTKPGQGQPSASRSYPSAGSSSGTYLGSIAHEGSPRIGRTSIARHLHSCASHQFVSCSENYAIRPKLSGQTLSAQTVLHVHRTLSQALAHAVKSGVLFKNPAEQVKPP